MIDEHDDTLKKAQGGVALVGEVLKAAGDNPNVKAAGEELGQSALTLAKTINNALLPLAAVNFAFERAKDYFQNAFQRDLSRKAQNIPTERLVEPKPSVAGPALQGLAFSHDESNLKEMYLSLLGSAMDSASRDDAHPAFVEIIKQLTSEEAQILKLYLSVGIPQAAVEIRACDRGKQTWSTLQCHVLPLKSSSEGEPIALPRISAIVDNWVRLGLVTVSYENHLAQEHAYDWVEKRPELIQFKDKYENAQTEVFFEKGMIERTALGMQFAKAVGLFEKTTLHE